METLSGFSIRQPWLDMILKGAKSLELRNWERPPGRRGLVVLHASWTIDFGAAHFYGYSEPWKLPRGVLLAVATIVDVVQVEEGTWWRSVKEHRQPVPSGGVIGIRFADVRPLLHRIKHNGRLFFFPLEQQASSEIQSWLESAV